jgi:hypothetical protein
MHDGKQEQLRWEHQWGRVAGIAAVLSILLFVAANFVAGGPPPAADSGLEQLEQLLAGSDRALAGNAITALSLLLLIPAMVVLHMAAKFRRPETPSVGLALAVLGPALYAATQVVIRVQLNAALASIETSPGEVLTPERLSLLVSQQSSAFVSGLALAASLAIGFAFILVGLNAMRAGLTSRFLGYVGIFVGVFYGAPALLAPFGLPPLLSPVLLQLFWQGAVGLVLLDRWPNGRGPAWSTGEATPWPSAADQRKAYEKRVEERSGGGSPAADSNGAGVDQPPATTPPRRTRKRRQ